MRFGPVAVARVLMVVTACGLGMVVVSPNLWVALGGFLLIGIGVCVTAPLTTSAAARLGDRTAAENVAAMTLANQIVMLGSPALMGLIASTSGIRMTFAAILPLVALSIVCARFLAPRR